MASRNHWWAWMQNDVLSLQCKLKRKQIFLDREMGISQCAHSASVCQEQQKIFNAQKGFNDLMNLLYWISQNPASKGFRKTCWLLTRTAYSLDLTYFMGYDRTLLHYFHFIYEDNYQNFSEVAASLFSGKSSCISRKKSLFIHTIFLRILKSMRMFYSCSPSWNIISLINEYTVGYTIQEKINNDNCERKTEVF